MATTWGPTDPTDYPINNENYLESDTGTNLVKVGLLATPSMPAPVDTNNNPLSNASVWFYYSIGPVPDDVTQTNDVAAYQFCFQASPIQSTSFYFDWPNGIAWQATAFWEVVNPISTMGSNNSSNWSSVRSDSAVLTGTPNLPGGANGGPGATVPNPPNPSAACSVTAGGV